MLENPRYVRIILNGVANNGRPCSPQKCCTRLMPAGGSSPARRRLPSESPRLRTESRFAIAEGLMWTKLAVSRTIPRIDQSMPTGAETAKPRVVEIVLGIQEREFLTDRGGGPSSRKEGTYAARPRRYDR